MKPFLIICSTALYFFAAPHADAASLRATPEQSPEGFVVATVTIDPEGTSFNGFSGTLLFEDENLVLVSIDTVDSVVGIWAERPLERTLGEISWSGLTPGGFGGVRSPFTDASTPGVLFRAVFRPVENGPIGFSFKDPVLYRNDGAGTERVPDIVPTSFVIETSAALDSVPASAPVPQSVIGFEADVVRDPAVAHNKWFVVFGVDTNRVSINTYEIAEYPHADALRVPDASWRAAENPYVLRKQSRRGYIHIRAIAFDGTVYTKTVPPADDAKYSTPTIIIMWSILILLVTVAFVRRYTRRR